MMTELFSIDDSQTSEPSRKAALVLHALTQEDKNWILNQLPDAQRQRLQPMLEELQSLGVPRNLGLIRDLLPTDVDAPPRNTPRSDEDTSMFSFDERVNQMPQSDVFMAKVNQLSLGECVELLANESAFLIAHLLHMHKWLWEYEFLNQLPREKRQQIEALLCQIQQTSVLPASLHTTMRRVILSRLPDIKIQTAPIAPPLLDNSVRKKPMHEKLFDLFKWATPSGRSRS